MSDIQTAGLKTKEIDLLTRCVLGQLGENEDIESMFTIVNANNVPFIWHWKVAMVVSNKQIWLVKIGSGRDELLFQTDSAWAIYIEAGSLPGGTMTINYDYPNKRIYTIEIDNSAKRRIRKMGPRLSDFKIGNSRELKKHGITRKRQ